MSSIFKSEAPSLGWSLELHVKLLHLTHPTSWCIVMDSHPLLFWSNSVRQYYNYCCVCFECCNYS